MAQTNQPDAFSRLLIQRLINLGQPVTAQFQDLKAAGIMYRHIVTPDHAMTRMASVHEDNPDPGMDVHILDHHGLDCSMDNGCQKMHHHYLEPFPVLTPGQQVFSASNLYATLSFLHAIKAAQAEGLDWFFLIEPDCRFAGHGWLRALWQELLMIWTPQMVCAGTPVAWNGHSRTLSQITRLTRAVKEQTGLPMDGTFVEGKSTSVGINGALGWYNTKAMSNIFAFGLKLVDLPEYPAKSGDLNSYLNKLCAWDYQIGRVLAECGDYDQTIGILSGSYSACGDRQMDEAQRLKLLADGKKLAVHQVKGAR